MKLSLALSAVISLAAISFIPSKTVQASQISSFGEQEINQSQFAVVAAPYRHGYNLLILEQVPSQQKCWEEVGSSPTVIKPLFLDFDFTDACKRSSDSNSYSIRFNGEDYGMDYLTDIVKQNGELHLIGVPRDRSKPQFHIGRTHGFKSGSLKIVLNPEWRLTKRLHEDNTTEHIYLSNNIAESEQLVSHAVQPSAPAPNYGQPIHMPASNVASNVAPIARPVQPNFGYQPPMPNTYQQPVSVYQQPIYQQPAYPQPSPLPQATNVYQQPVYYPVPPVVQPANVYSQPVYQQPVNLGYGQY